MVLQKVGQKFWKMDILFYLGQEKTCSYKKMKASYVVMNSAISSIEQ